MQTYFTNTVPTSIDREYLKEIEQEAPSFVKPDPSEKSAATISSTFHMRHEIFAKKRQNKTCPGQKKEEVFHVKPLLFCVTVLFSHRAAGQPLRAPRSYTGEDVVEIASHGGIYLLERILRACCSKGARPARTVPLPAHPGQLLQFPLPDSQSMPRYAPHIRSVRRISALLPDTMHRPAP